MVQRTLNLIHLANLNNSLGPFQIASHVAPLADCYLYVNDMQAAGIGIWYQEHLAWSVTYTVILLIQI